MVFPSGSELLCAQTIFAQGIWQQRRSRESLHAFPGYGVWDVLSKIGRMAKSVRSKSVPAASAVNTKTARPPEGLAHEPTGQRAGGGFAEIGQAIAGRFSALAGAWGFAAVTAVLTLFAACYAHAERDAVASYYDVSSSLIPVDPYSAIIPAILALAIGVGLYGVAVLLAIGFSVVKHLSKGKPGKGEGRVARWGDWLFATRVNKAPVPKIAKLAPAVSLLVAVLAVLTCVYMAGDHFGRSEARHGKQLLVLSDPKWCPPRPVGLREDCVVIASGSGTVLTRWIDPDDGRLGSATATWAGLGSGAVTTPMWFPIVRSPVVETAH